MSKNVEAAYTTETRNMLKKTLMTAVLMLFLIPVVALGLSDEDFDGIVAQIKNTTTFFDDSGTLEWTFTQVTAAQIAVAGMNNGGTFTNGLTNSYPGDQAIFLNYDALTSDNTTFGFYSTDGTHFALNSFDIGNNIAGYSTSVTINVFSGSTTVGSAIFSLNTSSTSGGVTYSYGGDSSGGSARPYGTLTFDSRYSNVDRVELIYSSAATPLIDNIDISPSVVVSTSVSSPTNASPIPVSIEFSESVTGFTLAGLSVTNGTASSFSGTGASYTADVTPTADGTVLVQVPAGVAQDAAGDNAASNVLSVTYDATAPTVAATSLQTTYVSHGPSSFTVTFSEPVADTGSGGADSVTNPANYLLVEAGSNGTFDTLSCAGGVVSDDTRCRSPASPTITAR